MCPTNRATQLGGTPLESGIAGGHIKKASNDTLTGWQSAFEAWEGALHGGLIEIGSGPYAHTSSDATQWAAVEFHAGNHAGKASEAEQKSGKVIAHGGLCLALLSDDFAVGAGEGFGNKLGPDCLPVVRAEVTAVDLSCRFALDGYAVLFRERTQPVGPCGYVPQVVIAQGFSECKVRPEVGYNPVGCLFVRGDCFRHGR